MDGKSTVGTQVREILGLLAARQRRGGAGAWGLSAEDMTAVERWDDLTESLLVAHDPRGRTIADPLAFIEGTLAERGDFGIEARYSAADRMSLAMRGAMFGFTTEIGRRSYWGESSGGDAWGGAWADFGVDTVYLLLEDEEGAAGIAPAAHAARPFGTARRHSAPRRVGAAAGRPTAARTRRDAGTRRAGLPVPGRRGQQTQDATDRARPTVISLEETAFSPVALPALDTALRRVATVWDEPASEKAAAPMGGRFSLGRFDDGLQVVTLRDDLPAAKRGVPGHATAGLGGGETPTQTPVYRYAYDAAADVFLSQAALDDSPAGSRAVPAPSSTPVRAGSAARPVSAAPARRSTVPGAGVAAATPQTRTLSVRDVVPAAPRSATTRPTAAGSSGIATVIGPRPVGALAPLDGVSPVRTQDATTEASPARLTRALARVDAPIPRTAVVPFVTTASQASRATAASFGSAEAGGFEAASTTPSAAALRTDRYSYASDLSVLPAEIFATSVAQRVADDAPAGAARYAAAPGAAYVSSPERVGRPSDLSAALDPVVYLSLPTEGAADPAGGTSGLRSTPVISSPRRLGSRVADRFTAPAVTVAEATRLQQAIAEGIRAERRTGSTTRDTREGRAAGRFDTASQATASPAVLGEGRGAERASVTSPISVTSGVTASVEARASSAGLRSLSRALGAPAAGVVPRSLRNALPTLGESVERAVRASGSEERAPVERTGIRTAVERTMAALPADVGPRLAVELGVTPRATTTGAMKDVERTGAGGLWLRFAGMEPVFLSLPSAATEPRSATGLSAAVSPTTTRSLDLTGRSSATPLRWSTTSFARHLAGAAALEAAGGVAQAEGTPASAGSMSPSLARAAGLVPAATASVGVDSARGASALGSIGTSAGAAALRFGVPPLVARLWSSVESGAVDAGLLERLALTRNEDAAPLAAFAPTVARFFGVGTSSEAPGRGAASFGAEEVGVLLSLERELRTAGALGSRPESRATGAGLSGAQQWGGRSVPTAPEVTAYPYLPTLSRQLTEQSRERALRMTSVAPVQRFMSGRTAEQFARLSVAEQRAVLQQLEQLAPPALARTVASVAEASSATPVGGGSGAAFWGGFAPRGLAAVLSGPGGIAPGAGGPQQPTYPSAYSRIGLPGLPGGMATGVSALRSGTLSPGTGGGLADARWVRETLELLLPSVFGEAEVRAGLPALRAATVAAGRAAGRSAGVDVDRGGGVGAAALLSPGGAGVLGDERATTAVDRLKTAPSRLAAEAPEGDLVRLPVGDRPTAPVSSASAPAPAAFALAAPALGQLVPELTARRTLRFADRLAAQVLGGRAEVEREAKAIARTSLGSPALARTAAVVGTGGRDVAGPMYWPGDDMALLASQADGRAEGRRAGAAAAGSNEGVLVPRHGATAAERADVGRDWSQAASRLAPLAELGRPVRGGDVARGPRENAIAGTAVDGDLVALGGRAPSRPVAALHETMEGGFRPGLLRASAEVREGRSERAMWTGASAQSARFVSWMQDRGVARIAYDRLSPTLAEAALLGLPDGAPSGDRAGAPLGFVFGGGSGFAAGVLQRLLGATGALGTASGSAGTAIGRSVDTESFVRLIGGESRTGGGPESDRGAAAVARVFGGGAVGETVSVGGAPRARSADLSDVRRIDWGRVGAHTSTPTGRGSADLVGIASAATMGREMSRSVLPLVAPMIQQVAQQAAAKAESAPAAEASSGGAGGGGGTAKGGGKKGSEEEKKKLRQVVDQVVARLQDKIRGERERRGGVLW